MRLWHYKIVPYLPKGQLVAQWRELGSIFAKEDKHILINYIYNYPKSVLKNYADIVANEMKRRGYTIRSFDNYNNYFKGVETCEMNFSEHDDEYLSICYWNLREKFIRGQKDFTLNCYTELENFYFNH